MRLLIFENDWHVSLSDTRFSRSKGGCRDQIRSCHLGNSDGHSFVLDRLWGDPPPDSSVTFQYDQMQVLQLELSIIIFAVDSTKNGSTVDGDL